MTNGENDNLKMVITRKGVMEANSTIWSGNDKISAGKAAVDAYLADILADAGIQEGDITGTTTAKNQSRIVAGELGVHISTGMRAYAEDIDDEVLFEKMHYTKTDLEKGDVMDALNKMNVILSEASAVAIAILLPFNVTAANLTDFSAAILALTTAVPQHGILQSEKKASTANIKKNFKLMAKAGKKLNTLVHTLALTQPAFVQIYDNSCIIINSGKGQMAEEVQMIPGEHVALFYRKFLPGDTITARNHSKLSKIKLYLSDTTDVPATGGFEMVVDTEFQLTVPDSFKTPFGHYLIIENLDKFDDAHVTVVLAHGKSHSSAKAPVLTNVVVPLPPPSPV